MNQFGQKLTSLNKASGSVYIRRGHHHCPGNTTEEIYSGFAAGGWYESEGTSPNYLCLPPDPQWANSSVSTNNYVGQIYGVEYQSNFFQSNRFNRDVPCALCRTENTATVMIPARNDCYPGWRKEYNGYLGTTERPYKAATDYICVDSSSETLIHSQQNEDGLLVTTVESVCGSLSCPPYFDHREVTCAVCSK